jgi:hypothetical protein
MRVGTGDVLFCNDTNNYCVLVEPIRLPAVNKGFSHSRFLLWKEKIRYFHNFPTVRSESRILYLSNICGHSRVFSKIFDVDLLAI